MPASPRRQFWTGSVRPEGHRGAHHPGDPQGSMLECPVREPCPPKCCYPDMRRSNPTCEAPGTTALLWKHQSGRGLALLWQFTGTFRGISVGYEFHIGKAKRRQRLWKRENCQSSAKLGSGYRQAANFSVPVAQYVSSGVRPASAEGGRRAL